jgi:Mrp family chromosome partitioning ATPase
MERIQAAIQKAKEQRGGELPPGLAPSARPGRPVPGAPGPAWAELVPFEPDPRVMERNRIVVLGEPGSARATFDMMRTKILRAMRQNGWTSLGITSPTSGCGKTTTCLNLAFSLANQSDVRTVLVDLDLRRPVMARHLGLTQPQSIASVLQGTRPVAENFVRYGENLAIGTNAQAIRNSAELLLNASTGKGVAAIKAAFAPHVLIYDLPPLLLSDDAVAFLPHLDCVLLIAGAEKSRLDEVDTCERDLAEHTNVLGVTLNMCRYTDEEYGYY